MTSLVPGRRRERWNDVDRKRAGPGAWGRRLAAAAILIYVALFAWTGHHVGTADAAYRDGRLEQAHETLARAAFWHVRAGRVNDALGVVDLARGRLDEARTHLTAARGGFFHPPAFGEESVLLSFLRVGKFEAAQIYAAHRLAVTGAPTTAFYLGVAENGLNRLDDSETHLIAATGDSSLKERAEAQRAMIATKRKTGRAVYLFDDKGASLAAIDIKTGQPALLVSELGPLLGGPYAIHLDPSDTAGHVRLSIDLEIQRAAEAALGAQRGSLVVIDVATGGLLAAASQPASWPSPAGAAPPALSRTYEPGSIIKLITLNAALRKGLDVEGMFPLDCPGWIAIDGVAFRDWMPHRHVASIDQAVAVSCNIAFGRLGGEVGRDALDAELRRFGFDLASGSDASAADFKVVTGALLPEDSAHPNYALARRAVGLDSIEITPMGAALLAAGLARGGAPPVPHLVEEKINLLGESYYKHQVGPPDTERLPAEKAALIARVMKAAVTGVGKAEGTARRAAVEGLAAAMKTGTSGKSAQGYDALVIGFAPADKPIIAWALVAEHAGKAELEGARITGEFLRKIRNRLP